MGRHQRSSQTRTCEGCGKTYHPFRNAVRTDRARFCSSKCSGSIIGKEKASSFRTCKLPTSLKGARWIPLGRGHFSLVDAVDYERVSALTWSWDGRSGSHVIYQNGRRVRRIRLHQFILKADGKTIVDHVNGDQSDCRRANLRFASASESICNRHKQGRSGRPPMVPYKGVWVSGRKWTAIITFNKKRRYLGSFSTPELAAKAYDDAARELHGQFARVNFPQSDEQSARRFA